MKIRFLNSNTEHKRFGFSPMYYDERKQKLAQKREQFKKLESGEISDEERREMLRGNLRNEYSRAEYRQKEQRSSNIRIIILLVVLLALGYLLFNGVNEVDNIVNNLW
ncbi:MAG: hypothetical protein ACI837_001823 [Crocinitomicaceae bacterium]|jgi:hypothetical protein